MNNNTSNIDKKLLVYNIWYKIITLCLCTYGIVSSVLKDGRVNVYVFVYFTTVSNIGAFLCLIINIEKRLKSYLNKNFNIYMKLKGMVLSSLMLTMIVYWTKLAPTSNSNFTLSNLCTHLFVPILMVIDWIVFDKKGNWRIIDCFKWLIMPLGYSILAFVAANCGVRFRNNTSRFPYPFLDMDVLGQSKTFFNIILLFVGFYIIGYIFHKIDKLFCDRDYTGR